MLGDTADVVVVAPATAHWLAAMANGLAGDVVSATCLATSAPVVVAPAMDGDMWTPPGDDRQRGPAARVRLRHRRAGVGTARVRADRGRAPGGTAAIVEAVVAAVGDRPVRAPDPAARPPIVGPARDADLAGRHVVVSAGGTREAIDPVRFIGNRSTGKMGAPSPRPPSTVARG